MRPWECLRHWMTFATRQSVTWSLIGQYPVGVLLWPTILYDIGWHRLGSLYYYIAVRLPGGSATRHLKCRISWVPIRKRARRLKEHLLHSYTLPKEYTKVAQLLELKRILYIILICATETQPAKCVLLHSVILNYIGDQSGTSIYKIAN